MKKEKTLIHRYDLEAVSSKQDASNLFNLINKYINKERSEVMWIKTDISEVRQQVKLYDIDKVIKHFEDKVKSGDVRFLKSWSKYLKTLRKIKKAKMSVK